MLAAVPVLYDAYQVQVEQQIMSDALFMLLVTAAVVLLCWDDRVAVPVAVAAGLLTGLATIVRSVRLPLLATAAVCLLAWRVGWRPLAALLAVGAVPVAGYLLVFLTQHHQLAMTDSGGTFLYGRVQTFAECSVTKPPASLAGLCDPRPPAQRPVATGYIWRRTDPLWNLRSHGRLFSPYANARAQAFAIRAIEAEAPRTLPMNSHRAGMITSPCISGQVVTSSQPPTESWPTSSSRARSVDRSNDAHQKRRDLLMASSRSRRAEGR